MKKAFLYTIITLAVLAALAGLLIEYGWAVSTLWGWFIVPLGGREISIPLAIGIGLTLGALRFSKTKKEDDNLGWHEKLIAPVVGPLVAVGLGWIVKQFV
jgi:hypothetical protein